MVANVVIVRDSPQCFRIVFHARLFTFLVDHRYRATSIIPSHHEIIRPVVHRGSDRSILFADLPVSRIRVAQSVSSSFGFPDNTRNTPVHFSASLSRTEGETRRGKFLYRNRNAWIVVREWTMRRGSRIRSYLDWIKICIVRGKRWSPIFGRTTETTSTRRVRMRVVKLNTRIPTRYI